MKFETNLDVLNWYEKQPRALTDEFISAIEWADVKKYPLDKKFIPVLMYMRDVETLTDMYYTELRRTPTGRDPVICKFMERWSAEELTHGELLNRFLNEAGIETDEKWQARVKRQVPFSYTINNLIISYLTNLIGNKVYGDAYDVRRDSRNVHRAGLSPPDQTGESSGFDKDFNRHYPRRIHAHAVLPQRGEYRIAAIGVCPKGCAVCDRKILRSRR